MDGELHAKITQGRYQAREAARKRTKNRLKEFVAIRVKYFANHPCQGRRHIVGARASLRFRTPFISIAIATARFVAAALALSF